MLSNTKVMTGRSTQDSLRNFLDGELMITASISTERVRPRKRVCEIAAWPFALI
jgi:hypothetical protein